MQYVNNHKRGTRLRKNMNKSSSFAVYANEQLVNRRALIIS
jgi:hypothetical protein